MGVQNFPPFSAALTQADLEDYHDSFSASYTIEQILTPSFYLLKLVENGNFFGTFDHDPYSPSLRTLYDRLYAGNLTPSFLPPRFVTEEHLKASIQSGLVPEEVTFRPLADFEDLYYALVARMREMQNCMKLRVVSGFNHASHRVVKDGPTIIDLNRSLSSYWDILNDPRCGKALDNAVREARVHSLHHEIVRQVENNYISAAEGESQILQLRSQDVLVAQPGLDWTPEWDPALVGAKLADKYRIILALCKKQDRMDRKKEKMREQINSNRERLVRKDGNQQRQTIGMRTKARRAGGAMRLEIVYPTPHQKHSEIGKHTDNNHTFSHGPIKSKVANPDSPEVRLSRPKPMQSTPPNSTVQLYQVQSPVSPHDFYHGPGQQDQICLRPHSDPLKLDQNMSDRIIDQLEEAQNLGGISAQNKKMHSEIELAIQRDRVSAYTSYLRDRSSDLW